VRKWGLFAAGIAVIALALGAFSVMAKETAIAKKAEKAAAKKTKADGGELFNREWLPGDARAAGGDGLGPVFNDTSCVACHNQGGVGGGGPASKNVDVVSVFSNVQEVAQAHLPATLPQAMFRSMFGGLGGPVQQVTKAATEVTKTGARDPKALAKQQKAELAKIHPGFVNARSMVLHKSSTDPAYDAWRAQMRGQGHFAANDTVFFATPSAGTLTLAADATAEGLEAVNIDFSGGAEGKIEIAATDKTKAEVQPAALARTATAQQAIQLHRMQLQQFRSATQGTQAHVGNFVFLGSQRNPTALFGAGLIDSIPEAVIKANAEKKHKDFPEVQGRVAKLKDGRIGRFGWKNQTASLYDFTMTACAVELGLDVPDHSQAGMPQKPDYKSPGHDLTKDECDSLVNFLRNLPAPQRAKPANKQEGEYLAMGENKFVAVGCATCHTKDLGNAEGIYSDLLLHDMGQDLGDTGSYGIFVPNSPEEGGDEPIPSLAQQQPMGMFGVGAAGTSKAEREKTIGALRQEWRTPPLWGIRDSGPYLHDGRADTLDQAIALHGGEAARSAQRFFELSPEEKMQVMAFLKSLRAPQQVQVAAR
jgi:CxxC motif-containing protein (DUF1111 family)